MSQSVTSFFFRADVVKRSLKTALIVGTILALINYGEWILNLSLTGEHIIKILMTYLVPYSVSTYASASALKTAHDNGC